MHTCKGLGYSLVGFFCCLALIIVLADMTAASNAEAAEGGVYENVNVQPLATEECARCHFLHYTRIKTNGARHTKVLCTDCHDKFHAYNPTKANYAELMPKCASCHTAPHGDAEAVQQCLNCHTDPHQPLAAIPDPANLEGQCRLCHTEVAASLQAKPSKHTSEACSSCHSQKHGRIPECSECHENHSPLVQLAVADCMACHPVHTPLAISYPENQDSDVCAGCHENAYNLLKDRVTRHTVVKCSQCHPSHGEIPQCQRCHSQPHSSKIHEKYPTCGSCHSIAHDIKR